MAGFKSPDFNERTAAARAARQAAVEQLRNKPAPDPAVLAERQAARAAREEQRAAKKAEAEEAKAKRAEAARIKAEAAQADAAKAAAEAAVPERTEAELKAARDARYAARKARQR
ncbi:hypothetical protein GCM10007420_08760 [Glycocaulis albus]|uniref:Uncharacterized protein n=1 Tax=Glycocaulis albus TaxID=1382801 RepID=A0ABQ1XJM2_9PROT|nr:DUF6481 family protein [Glycocaulis albus]MBV5259212.1 hypothetical protein [Synechococcus moorigangaii CMS01]GGG95434.1 hypothetical protein GCM10007420_08760 [Glycocaulis albus]